MMTLEPRNYKLKAQRGFMALMSAIIISAILLLIAVSLSTTSFYDRSNILDFELKEKSSALAEACTDTAILRLTKNLSYVPSPPFNFTTQTGGEPIIVDSDQCTIVSVDTFGSHIIKTQAIFNNAYTNLRVIINPATFAVQSWEECTNLTSSITSC